MLRYFFLNQRYFVLFLFKTSVFFKNHVKIKLLQAISQKRWLFFARLVYKYGEPSARPKGRKTTLLWHGVIISSRFFRHFTTTDIPFSVHGSPFLYTILLLSSDAPHTLARGRNRLFCRDKPIFCTVIKQRNFAVGNAAAVFQQYDIHPTRVGHLLPV